MRIHALADVVGYNTVTLKKGYNMIALNFQNVGEVQTIGIQDLIPGTTEGLTAGANTGAADCIMVYDSATGNYATYFIYKSARGTNVKDYQWVDAKTTIATKTFASGDAFWFVKQGADDVNISLAGQVSNADKQSITLLPGYNMIGNEFPANFNPNSMTDWQSSGAVAGANTGTADCIMVYDAATGNYATYFLYKSARGTNVKDYQWVDAKTNLIDPTSEIMSAGKGSWYLHRGQGYSLNIVSPIK